MHNGKSVAPKIDVGMYVGTPIDQLPNSYLRWMMTQDFPKEWLYWADKKLKESDYEDAHLSISRHAVDMYSKRFLARWIASEARKTDDAIGLASFMTARAEEAWEKGIDVSKNRHQNDGIVKEFDGIKWVFALNMSFPEYKTVITVMPSREQ